MAKDDPRLLTEAQLHELVWVAGDEMRSDAERIAARNRVIEANVGLVKSVVKRYAPYAPFDDAFQVGVIGMIRAVEKFNPDLGFNFSTYATYWIKQAVQRMLDRDSTVQMPAYLKELDRAMRRRDMTLETPASTVLAKIPRATPQRLERLRAYRAHLAPTHTNLEDDAELFVAPQPEETTLERDRTLDRIRQCVDHLDEPERTVVRLYYGFGGEPMTLEAVGVVIGRTRERVRQLIESALWKVSNHARNLPPPGRPATIKVWEDDPARPVIVRDTYNAHEVAVMLHATDRRVREWLQSGVVRGVKRGDGWVVAHADLMDFLSVRPEYSQLFLQLQRLPFKGESSMAS